MRVEAYVWEKLVREGKRSGRAAGPLRGMLGAEAAPRPLKGNAQGEAPRSRREEHAEMNTAKAMVNTQGSCRKGQKLETFHLRAMRGAIPLCAGPYVRGMLARRSQPP